MTRSRKTSARAPTILVLVSATLLASCQARTEDSYQMTGTKTVTALSSGFRKQIKQWRYEDGTTTQSAKVAFDPQAGRSPRGTKFPH